MVGWLLPVSIFSKTFTNVVFENFAQLPVIFLFFFLLARLNSDPSLVMDILPRKKTIAIILLFVTFQIFLMLRQAFLHGDSYLGFGFAHGLATFFQVVLAILLAYSVQTVFIRKTEDVFMFLNSLLYTLAFYLLLVVLPQIVVSFGGDLTKWVNTMASFFERRWQGRSWYEDGSYAATLHRVNGFEPEAPFLVMLLGLVFSPILISVIQEHTDNFRWLKKFKAFAWPLLLAVMVVLLTAKATSGFLMFLFLAIFLIIFAPKNSRKKIFQILVIAGSLMLVLYISVPGYREIVSQWLLKKQGTDNRLGGTIGLWESFIHHPILGVGFGNEGIYIHQFLPDWSKHNSEYINVYSKVSYPILNDFLGWLARFGVVFVGLFIYFIIRLWLRTVTIYKEIFGDTSAAVVTRIALRSFIMFVPLVGLFSLITQINAFSWPMLLIIFFYWRVISITESQK
ncbi:O-antigen ligase family protein [Weissella cibaria]|uniref:O-antigen ligase family protein n=1 Tax=Weissella cibaria TaxID=137591 RepID=UPI001FF5FBBC|nr:O-antigen ligase family protein [Weissella cibaria]UOX36044.1 hypothetical protein IDM39_07940 [Weissella cibaria]